MRQVGLLVVVMACSPASPEPLHAPHPLPHPCKTAEQIGALERPIVAASNARRDAALASFLADRRLALTGQRLNLMLASDRNELPDARFVGREIEKALADPRNSNEPRLVVDLGRPAWSQVIVDFAAIQHAPCGDSVRVAYELARDASGATVVVRTHTSPSAVMIGEQCGECSVGCGFPGRYIGWAAVVLPFATGEPLRVENLDLVEDEIVVRCEREVQAI